MPIRAVIFDFGGVLVRTEDQAGRRAWEQRLGLPPNGLAHAVFDSEVARAATRGLVPAAQIWEHVAQSFHLDAATLEQLRTAFWSGDRVDTELVDYIRQLRPAYKTAILSNAWSNGRRVIGIDYGLAETFDELVISAEEGLAKPDVRTYQIAAARLGVAPQEAVFVDDFSANIAGAQAAGMHGVHFRSRAQAIAEIEALLQAA
jgi:putative hydrolase of the HAD superfamily